MGVSKEQDKQQDSSKVVFDPAAFMDQVMSTIDNLCGDYGSRPTEVIENTFSLSQSEKAESKLNCFYRLIGLPATRSASKLPKQGTFEPEVLEQNKTINYFDEKKVSFSNEPNIGDVLSSRQGLLERTRKSSEHSAMLNEPLSIRAAVDPNDNQSRRVRIFPLLVDASVPIFPLNKRVAPLFYDGDFMLSGKAGFRLPRPFLETVIYIRTQVLSGREDGNKVTEIFSNLDRFINSNLSNNDATSFKRLFNSDGRGIPYQYIEAQIISKFITALNKAAVDYRKVQQKIHELNGQIKYTPVAKSTEKEKAGNDNVSLVDINPEGQITIPAIDQAIASLQVQIENINLLNSTLPTERVMQSDKIRRIDQGTTGLSNVTSDIFVSEFSSLISYEKEDIEKQLSQAQNDKARITSQFEQLRKLVMYYSGEISGISIFDILCIFLALFTVDIGYLVGLLNSEAQERLMSNKFFSSQNDPDVVTVQDTSFIDNISGASFSVLQSRDALEKKVTEYFNLAESFYSFALKSGEIKK